MMQGPSIVASGIGEIRHTQPVLSVGMSPDGSVFSAGCDNKGMMWTPNPAGGQQQPRQIAEVGQPKLWHGVRTHERKEFPPLS